MQMLSPPPRRASSSPKNVAPRASGEASGDGPLGGPGGRRAACRSSVPRRGRNRHRRAENPGMAYSPTTTCTFFSPRRPHRKSTNCALAVASMAMIRGQVRSRRSINASTRPSCCIVGE
ncbi:TPA_asm: UL9.4 [Human alphaherpesvirus 1]|nr:TPA_asm: UL9.4 [Human alphaherpesvirus 1]